MILNTTNARNFISWLRHPTLFSEEPIDSRLPEMGSTDHTHELLEMAKPLIPSPVSAYRCPWGVCTVWTTSEHAMAAHLASSHTLWVEQAAKARDALRKITESDV